MSRDPDEIQHEIEQARDQLAVTLDQLARRYSFGAVAHRGRRAVARTFWSPNARAVIGAAGGLLLLRVISRSRR